MKRSLEYINGCATIISAHGFIVSSVLIFFCRNKIVHSYTVTFTERKDGMTEANCGNIIVVDIGIPDQVFRFAGPGDLIYYKMPTFLRKCDASLYPIPITFSTR